MFQKRFSKFLSILMGLLMGLVVLFLIAGLILPDLNLPTLKDLLETENNKQINFEELENNSEIALESTESSNEELKQISITALEDGVSAWDLLTANHQVLYQEYDFGIYIEEINGLKGDQDNFWAIYINDESALVGIQDIVLNEGDVIEFRYEAIKK
jgi:mannitol-specific phosphotransferase system IIBC component